jgi:hypothetical protein
MEFHITSVNKRGDEEKENDLVLFGEVRMHRT